MVEREILRVAVTSPQPLDHPRVRRIVGSVERAQVLPNPRDTLSGDRQVELAHETLALGLVLADVVEVDVLAQAGELGDVHVAFVVHGVHQLVEPGVWLLVVDEGMQ